jgi:class 3 adenylate cyclase
MYKQSIDSHRKYKELQDTIYSKENNDKIASLEKAREDDIKQKEIEKQKIRIAEQEKREKLILYFSIGFFIVMAIVMIVIYRLLKRSDKLLYNVLPVSIAKRLKKKEHPISDYFTQASIVFIDIVNFTELSKDEDPRRVVEALNKIFTKYDTISNKYGLEKIKTIGDSYMAAAGIPEVQKDNTHRAAQMALEVKEMMQDYHTTDGTKIEVRIGLDCGPVVAGVIGENKFIYDMWSDAVNTASRMESSSIAGEVHVSERFKEAVTEYEQFEYVERGEIEIKGKGKMKTFFMGSKIPSHSEATQ